MSSSTRSRRRNARLLTVGAVVAGLAASGALVWHASYSAFSAQTTNPSSNWSAGTVALTDDDSNTALFNASNLTPGATGTKCIAVTSTGSAASAVKLYGTNPSTTKNLSKYINLTITQGTGGTFGSCTGFNKLASGSNVFSGTLEAFGTTKTDYTSGAGDWAPTGSASDTRVYQITYTLDAATPNTSQGGTAGLGLTWEAQNS